MNATPDSRTPAEVDERDQRQDRQAERQRVGLQRGDGRDQGADARPRCRRPRPGRSRASAPRRRAGPRSCPGSPWRRCTSRPRGDRPRSSGGRRSRRPASRAMISVRDRPDVADAGRAQGDQERQRGLRAVGRRAQRVEPEHGDAGQDADPLFSFLERRQPPAEQVVRERHRLPFANRGSGRFVVLVPASPSRRLSPGQHTAPRESC